MSYLERVKMEQTLRLNLIYQTDTCMILHCANCDTFEAIKDYLKDNDSWRLIHEATINDCNFYLIYWLV